MRNPGLRSRCALAASALRGEADELGAKSLRQGSGTTKPHEAGFGIDSHGLRAAALKRQRAGLEVIIHAAPVGSQNNAGRCHIQPRAFALNHPRRGSERKP